MTKAFKDDNQEYVVEMRFKTKAEAATCGILLYAMISKQYKSRSIPKGVMIEDYVNLRRKLFEVCDNLTDSEQLDLAGSVQS